MNHYTLWFGFKLLKEGELIMINKYKQKTEDDFKKMIETVTTSGIPCIGFIEGNKFQDFAIQFGAVLSGQEIGLKQYKNVVVNHALNTTGNISQTFEADGVKLTYHNLLDYKADFLSGNIRMLFYQPKIWNVPEFMDAVNKAIAEYLNDNYNGWENFWFGVGDFLAGTPLRSIIGWIPNPAYRKNSVVCSQLAILIYKYIPEIYNTVLAGQDITHMQPETLLILIIKYFNFIYDSEDVIK
jgi:hypothetical protein